MFSIGKTLHYGEKKQISKQCKCGSQTFWHATVLRSLKFSIFALLPLKDDQILKCSKCQREFKPRLEDSNDFSQLNLSSRLSQFAGIPFLVVIGLMLMAFYGSIPKLPQDTRLQRVNKRI